jgi:hypothetical protein
VFVKLDGRLHLGDKVQAVGGEMVHGLGLLSVDKRQLSLQLGFFAFVDLFEK